MKTGRARRAGSHPSLAGARQGRFRQRLLFQVRTLGLEWLEDRRRDDQVAQLIVERKALYRRWWRYSPPDILGGKIDDAIEKIGIPAKGEQVVHGHSVSPGFGEGRARGKVVITVEGNPVPE